MNLMTSCCDPANIYRPTLRDHANETDAAWHFDIISEAIFGVVSYFTHLVRPPDSRKTLFTSLGEAVLPSPTPRRFIP